MRRRDFLKLSAGLPLVATVVRGATLSAGMVMTVRGARPSGELGFVLPHEHVLVDFIGAAEFSPARYDADVAMRKIRPYLEEAKRLGCVTLFECTPAFLGRDPRLLLKLSEATGLNLITNTGYYAARQHKFVPAAQHDATPETLAEGWIRESERGIEDTGVRPGFIKLGFDAGPLSALARRVVVAATLTHRATGLTIAAHTGDDVAARGQLALLREHHVQPSAWIWVHAQNARQETTLIDVAQSGAWVSLDGVAPRSLTRHVTLVLALKRAGLLERVMISQDAGWYRPGEPEGGQYRGYDFLFSDFLPALRREGISDAELHQLTVLNPAAAFAIRPRLLP